MKPIIIHEYIHIGALHWYLVSLPTDPDSKGNDSVSSTLLELKQKLTDFGLPVTVRAGHKLWEFADKLASSEYPRVVTADDANQIRLLAGRLEDTLIAEASVQIAYVITEKRLDIKKLVESPGKLLAPNVYRQLPAVSSFDFMTACKAIAFELPTAAAFHLLRCTEGVLRHYYTCNIKVKRLRPERRMWHNMIEQLRQKRTAPPPRELLDTLDRIRENFRNPTNHPDKIYEIEEVQDLFGLCVDVLNRMVQPPCWTLPKDSLEVFIAELKKKRSESTSSKS